MGKLWKILLAIGGIIAGLFMLKSNTSKKEFTKKTKANDKKIKAVNKKVEKVKKDKAVTKAKINKISTQIKSTKSKIKSTKTAKSTIDKFDKKYRSKK
tara:strand:+ start:239 stop:532 length:294 start_codon:yes stop_codon:yes gene_type:complete